MSRCLNNIVLILNSKISLHLEHIGNLNTSNFVLAFAHFFLVKWHDRVGPFAFLPG